MPADGNAVAAKEPLSRANADNRFDRLARNYVAIPIASWNARQTSGGWP
jgi:hypothetical protein